MYTRSHFVIIIDISVATEHEQRMNGRVLYEKIGGLIRSRRKQLDLTQVKLAQQLGMSRASLANMETGRQNILVHQLYILAQALDLHPSDLLPQPDEQAKGTTGALPLPTGLKAVQKEQIARLLEGTPTQLIQKGGANATKKRV